MRVWVRVAEDHSNGDLDGGDDDDDFVAPLLKIAVIMYENTTALYCMRNSN